MSAASGLPAQTDDSLDARIPSSCPANIAEILRHAWNHDLALLKPLLSVPGRASVQEPTTGETPLHAAIRPCGAATATGEEKEKEEKKARDVVHELFMSGAIWNDVDSNNETPGCLADRLRLPALYQLCVEAGVRAELLFGLLDGYEELSSEEDEDEDEDDTHNGEKPVQDADAEAEEKGKGGSKEEKAPKDDGEPEDIILESDPDRAFVPPGAATAASGGGSGGGDVNSEEYLRSSLTYEDGKLVDSARNGVMMAWETSIMQASVDALLGPDPKPAGRRILNIGFGMGIVDGMFAAAQPAVHHIIEAHPAVLEHIRTSPDCKFGPAWEASGPREGAFKVHAGKWQDVIPRLIEQGQLYDAIYFDTFGEDYEQLRQFFTENVPLLLDSSSSSSSPAADQNQTPPPPPPAFGFFNGLGADRRVCYDVYARVVEMHLGDAGLDVEWRDLDVDLNAGAGLDRDGEGEWRGVRRRYWTLDKYRLPTCTLMG